MRLRLARKIDRRASPAWRYRMSTLARVRHKLRLDDLAAAEAAAAEYDPYDDLYCHECNGYHASAWCDDGCDYCGGEHEAEACDEYDDDEGWECKVCGRDSRVCGCFECGEVVA